MSKADVIELAVAALAAVVIAVWIGVATEVIEWFKAVFLG